MESSKVKSKHSLYDRFDKRAQRIAGTVSAILVIGGAVFGAGAWINDQVTNAISAQISDLKSTMQDSDKQQNQQITRLELMNLMQNDPTNKAAIEKMARYYFVDLSGDQYMTGKYSDWANQYGGDISFVIGGK